MDNNFRVGNGEDLFRIAERINFTQPIDNEEIQFEVNQLLNDLNKRTNANDAFELLFSLSILSVQRVFPSNKEAEKLIENLNNFGISIPEIVINCKREVNERTIYIERFFRNKDYNLTEEEEKEILSKLEKDCFDQESKVKAIKEKLNELNDQFKEKEKVIFKKYGIDISDFYESIIENEKSININDYFYQAQLHVETIDFPALVLSFIRYIQYKKKYYFLKNLYQENFEKKIEPKVKKPIEENIWFKVGLTFAKGDAQALYRVHKNYSEVTRQLGFDVQYRNFFARTFANNPNVEDNKNIYSQPDKLKEIFDYCQRENIGIVEDFKKHLSKAT